jgi:uncharacterized protein YqjF (DUF2071 family)
MLVKRPVFLTASWNNLVMINYEIDREILLPYLPFATQLDEFNGKTLVSVVGFMFNNTKVFGVRWPFHTHFEEVNLRFYVKHLDGNVWKRGVVFISEIVPKPVISFMANSLYHEQYSAKPMQHQTVVKDGEMHIAYKWRHRKKWNTIEVTADTTLTDIKQGSEEEFIFEHYWGYNKYSEGVTIEYGVEHARWQIHPVKEWKLECNIASLYGQSFVSSLTAQPSSVFLAEGSEVIIRKPIFIKKH